MRALVSHQRGPGSNPGVNAKCGLSLLMALSLAPRGFTRVVFRSPQILTLLISNSMWNARKRYNEFSRIPSKGFEGKQNYSY